MAAATAGSSTLEKEVMWAMVSRPSPIREWTSPTATAATARVPARAEAGTGSRPVPPYRLSARAHSSTITRMSTPERTARRATPASSPVPVSSSWSSPSSRPVP